MIYTNDDELTIPPSENNIRQMAYSKPTTLFAFSGVSGGSGVTTLCIQTAYYLKQTKNDSVCLIDLDFENGMVTSYMDTTPKLSISDINISQNVLIMI